jgi:DNA-binding FadR family transcriptional regulator
MLALADQKPDSRSEEAYRQLVAYIDGEGAGEGARLPSETELAEMFKTSRTSIREALARLRAEGRTVSRRGSGTFLRHRAERTEMVRLSAIESVRDVIDWLEFRVALESEIAALAAERRTEAELSDMRRKQQALIDTLAGAAGEREDAAFHHAIAAGAHNPKLIEASNALTSHIFRWAEVTRKHVVLTLAERREIIAVEHGDIIEAIADGRAADARSAARRHLLNGRARLLSSLSR